MNRREAIRKTGFLLGMAASSPLLMHVLQGCTSERSLNWVPQFFSKEQAILVAEIANLILPKTETPGALDVGVDQFIDKMVAEVYSVEAQQKFVAGLANLDKGVKKKSNKLFVELSEKDKNDVLYQLESQQKQLAFETNPTDKPFFLMIKELCLLGYFTSEIIITQHLDYLPIPMQLNGCEPLQPNQKLRVGNHF